MPEPLKNSFGPEIAERIGTMIEDVWPEFDRRAFLEAALVEYEQLDLTPRARQIATAMAAELPDEPERAIGIVVESLGPPIEETELTGMDGFVYMPHAYLVADIGLDCFEPSMRALHEITRRFTSEFAIRPFLERYPERTLEWLHDWAEDPDVHVRRLVSEGTRPRLPWAGRLRSFQEDPEPVLELLEKLKDDSEEYVRRSVANNLNDIAKDHPERVVEVAANWWKDGDRNRRRLVRHGLRTLIKQGHDGALEVLGYSPDTPARVDQTECTPPRVAIGGKVRLEARIVNPSDETTRALVDFRVHFVKANGSTSPKVFKGGQVELRPDETARVRKTISLAQHSTRTHYSGEHRVEVLLNGNDWPGCRFELLLGRGDSG